MSQNAVIVTCYPGRRKHGRLGWSTDEVWIVAEVQPAEAARSQDRGDWELDKASAGKLGEQLEKAVASVLAGDVVGLVWKADNLPAGQLDGFIAGLPDSLQALADKQLNGLAVDVAMPAPAALLTSQVAGTMLLKPVMKRVENTVHGLEVAGVVIGLLTGGHALVFICVKHLIRDTLGDLLSNEFGLAISEPTVIRLLPAEATPKPDGPSPGPSPFGL